MQQQTTDTRTVGFSPNGGPARPHLSRRSRALHRYTVLVGITIAILIFIGGQVKSTESGLSVPDWPNTYGHFMFSFPWEAMVGGVFWEHLHRMIASIVGLLTFVLTYWVYRVDTRRWVKRLAMAASVAVLVQGILGGLTVLFYLPAWLSSSHGTLAQIYFCTVVALALVTSPSWQDTPQRMPDSPSWSLRSVALATTLIIFAQLIFGAIMRHSESGLAIPDFPTMFGSWIPPLSGERLAEANRELWKLDYPAVDFWQMLSHVWHRTWAGVVTIMICWSAIKVFREHPGNAGLRRPAVLLLVLLAVQVTLGILTVLTEKQFTITSLHVVTGAMTLATSVVLVIRAYHHLYAPARAESYSTTVTEKVAV